MALVRFKLDPKAADVERPPTPQPRAAPPAPASPFAPPLPPPPASAAPTRSRRKLAIAAVVVAALLLIAGGVGAYFLLFKAYPDKYLVQSGEAPSGIRFATLTQSEKDQVGIRSNPGKVDDQQLADKFAQGGSPQPAEGWAEALDTGSGRLAVFALRYGSDNDAKDSTSTLRAACGFANGAVLRDGKIVVIIIPQGSSSRSGVLAVSNVIRDKVSALKPVCGTG